MFGIPSEMSSSCLPVARLMLFFLSHASAYTARPEVIAAHTKAGIHPCVRATDAHSSYSACSGGSSRQQDESERP